MQAKEAVHAAQQQQPKETVTAKAPIRQGQVALFEWIKQFLQQVQFVLVLVALGVIEQSASGQAEHPNELQERETAAGFLTARLRISALVFGSIGRAGAGAVNDLDIET